MPFVALIVHNVRTRTFRAAITAAAVAIGITAVVTLGVLTYSLRETAVSILRTGKADFSVAQKGVSDVLYSAIDEADVARIRAMPGVESAIGALVATARIDADHPFFIEIGLPREQLSEFGVKVVAGRAFDPTAADEMMLGYRAARDFGVHVGDTFKIEERRFKVVGLYSTGVVFGDLGGMFSLPTLQEWHRKPGVVTLAFVRAKPGTKVPALRKRIEADHPQLATVRSETEYGRVDRNLILISAANVGGSLLALFIGATGVMNTSLLSFYERIREFGVLRAIGWSRRRVLALVLGEAFLVAFVGAVVGIGIGFLAVRALTRVPDLVGVFKPAYNSWIFTRALLFASGMALLGALYPAYKAARLVPLEALRRE
ncbi:MAG: ABC transporter permease [Acidimicrobiia bacterium]